MSRMGNKWNRLFLRKNGDVGKSSFHNNDKRNKRGEIND